MSTKLTIQAFTGKVTYSVSLDVHHHPSVFRGRSGHTIETTLEGLAREPSPSFPILRWFGPPSRRIYYLRVGSEYLLNVSPDQDP